MNWVKKFSCWWHNRPFCVATFNPAPTVDVFVGFDNPRPSTSVGLWLTDGGAA